MQMATMLIVIKGHLPLHVAPSSSVFISLPFYLLLLVNLFAVSPINLLYPLHFLYLVSADEQLIAEYSSPTSNTRACPYTYLTKL